jgi:hypothetical protein
MKVINDFKLAIEDNTLSIRKADNEAGYDYIIHDSATDLEYSVNYSEYWDEMDIAIFKLDTDRNETDCLIHKHCSDPFGIAFGDVRYGAFTRFYKLIQA